MSIHDRIAELMKNIFSSPAEEHANIFYKIGKIMESDEYIDSKKHNLNSQIQKKHDSNSQIQKYKKTTKKVVINHIIDDDILQFDMEL